MVQTKLGEPIALDKLSELIDGDRPKAFYDIICDKGYGLSPEIPADERTLNQFRRFTGQTEGLSIRIEAHLLGSKIELDIEAGTLTVHGLPTQLTGRLKRTTIRVGSNLALQTLSVIPVFNVNLLVSTLQTNDARTVDRSISNIRRPSISSL